MRPRTLPAGVVGETLDRPDGESLKSSLKNDRVSWHRSAVPRACLGALRPGASLFVPKSGVRGAERRDVRDTAERYREKVLRQVLNGPPAAPGRSSERWSPSEIRDRIESSRPLIDPSTGATRAAEFPGKPRHCSAHVGPPKTTISVASLCDTVLAGGRSPVTSPGGRGRPRSRRLARRPQHINRPFNEDTPMTPLKAKHWSAGLHAETRELIETRGEHFRSLDVNLHFKNIDGRYGYMSLFDLYRGDLYVIDKSDGTRTEFADVDALLAADWALD